MTIDSILLQVRDLKVHFKLPRPHLTAPRPVVRAVDGVGFEVPRGRTFGLVGESGCGKSTTALGLLRLIEPTGGKVLFDDLDVLAQNPEEMRRLRRRMQIVFQDPYSSLNPRASAGAIVGAPLDIQKIGSPSERKGRVAELFGQVGLRPEQVSAFPHQFSGGQRQRICIARALASDPDLIVCDEPVSALDVAIQAQIINLLVELQKKLGLTYLFISHDMAVVQHICDDIAVMYLGNIVEKAGRRTLFTNPLHPYTQALLSAVPKISANRGSRRNRIRLSGDPPSPTAPPSGCRFHTRCPLAEGICLRERPRLLPAGQNHLVACHLAPRA